MRILSTVIFLYISSFTYGQCTAAPEIILFNYWDVCENYASEDGAKVDYYSTNQQPVDSVFITLYRYIDENRDQKILTKPRFGYKGTFSRVIYIDLSGVNLGFGLVAEFSASNNCGEGSKKLEEIPVIIPLKVRECNSNYSTEITGNTVIDYNDNSPQNYSLYSPELDAFDEANMHVPNLKNAQFAIWKLEQFEGGSYSLQIHDSLFVARRGVQFDSIPPGKSYLIFSLSASVCDCFNETQYSDYDLDTLVIEKSAISPISAWVNGITYANDDLSNCNSENNPISKQIIKITPGEHYTTTDENGFFSIRLDSGSYNLNLIGNTGDLCIPEGQNFHLNPGDTSNLNVVQIFSEQNVSIATMGRALMQVDSYKQTINLKNLGLPISGSLSVNILEKNSQPSVNYESGDPTPSSVMGSTVQWSNLSLDYLEEREFKISGSLGNVEMGDTIFVQINFVNQDTVFSVNSGVEVLNSYDPNDKQVSQETVMYQDLIQKRPELAYRIRFQNTGNDTAFSVVVVDSLPQGLDLSSLHLGPASHDFVFKIEEDRILKWTFNDIDLASQAVNEDASQGYLYFYIKPSQNLSPDDSVDNRVSIFFDLNEPIITNFASTRIVDESTRVFESNDFEAKLFPNPAKDAIYLMSKARIENISIHAVDGKLILSKRLNKTESKLDVSDIKPGTYFIRLIDVQGKMVGMKFFKE